MANPMDTRPLAVLPVLGSSPAVWSDDTGCFGVLTTLPLNIGAIVVVTGHMYTVVVVASVGVVVVTSSARVVVVVDVVVVVVTTVVVDGVAHDTVFETVFTTPLTVAVAVYTDVPEEFARTVIVAIPEESVTAVNVWPESGPLLTVMLTDTPD
jgi:hypothetical protein